VKCSAPAFEAYNNSALEIFTHHSEHCWWCREKNLEAIEELARRRRFLLEEEARLRRLREEEEARRRLAGEQLLNEELRRQLERERLEVSLRHSILCFGMALYCIVSQTLGLLRIFVGLVYG